MALEIERKFLVTNLSFKENVLKRSEIIQGYLSSDPEKTVRIRFRDNTGFISIKGVINDSRLTRFEWEKEITADDAIELLKLCEPYIVHKIRYYVPYGNHIFEVDEFLGKNQGLILAEIELNCENETFEKPEWLGIEVTNDIRYYNSWLAKNSIEEIKPKNQLE